MLKLLMNIITHQGLADHALNVNLVDKILILCLIVVWHDFFN